MFIFLLIYLLINIYISFIYLFIYFNWGIVGQCFFLKASRSVSPYILAALGVASLVRVPLWGPRCHIAHTHSPNAANRAPPVPPAPHPTTIPWPWGSDALSYWLQITGVCWRDLHALQSPHQERLLSPCRSPTGSQTPLNLCLPPFQSSQCICHCQPPRAGLLEVIT